MRAHRPARASARVRVQPGGSESHVSARLGKRSRQLLSQARPLELAGYREYPPIRLRATLAAAHAWRLFTTRDRVRVNVYLRVCVRARVCVCVCVCVHECVYVCVCVCVLGGSL